MNKQKRLHFYLFLEAGFPQPNIQTTLLTDNTRKDTGTQRMYFQNLCLRRLVLVFPLVLYKTNIFYISFLDIPLGPHIGSFECVQ